MENQRSKASFGTGTVTVVASNSVVVVKTRVTSLKKGFIPTVSRHGPFIVLFFVTLEQGQKKKVAQEEEVSRKLGLGIRLLPSSQEDAASAAGVKFSSKFESNRKDKRAAIKAASIFGESSSLSSSGNNSSRLSELEAKRRKIEAVTASALLTGRIRPSSWIHGLNGASLPIARSSIIRRR